MVQEREEAFNIFPNSDRSWKIELDDSLNVVWMNKKASKGLEYSEDDIGNSIIKSFHNLDKRKLEYASEKTNNLGKLYHSLQELKISLGSIRT